MGINPVAPPKSRCDKTHFSPPLLRLTAVVEAKPSAGSLLLKQRPPSVPARRLHFDSSLRHTASPLGPRSRKGDKSQAAHKEVVAIVLRKCILQRKQTQILLMDFIFYSIVTVLRLSTSEHVPEFGQSLLQELSTCSDKCLCSSNVWWPTGAKHNVTTKHAA